MQVYRSTKQWMKTNKFNVFGNGACFPGIWGQHGKDAGNLPIGAKAIQQENWAIIWLKES